MRLAYADPPYLGLAHYYKNEPTYGGEVDHEALIQRLKTYDGWGLSASAKSLRTILPMCPPEARVMPWVKPIGVSRATYGPHNTWEALIVMPARLLRPGKRDFLYTHPARGGGELLGRKPLAFWAFLFDMLGAVPGLDTFDDLFPGTRIGSKAWANLSLTAGATRRPRPSVTRRPELEVTDSLLGPGDDASSSPRGDVFCDVVDDVSRQVLDDASPTAARNRWRSLKAGYQVGRPFVLRVAG